MLGACPVGAANLFATFQRDYEYWVLLPESFTPGRLWRWIRVCTFGARRLEHGSLPSIRVFNFGLLNFRLLCLKSQAVAQIVLKN